MVCRQSNCAGVLMTIEWVVLFLAQGLLVAKPISVCELSASAHEYDGKQVRLVAKYITDRRHGAYFIDKKCPRSNVAQGIDSEEPKDPSVVAFDQAISAGSLTHKLAMFEVDVTGRYDSSGKGSLSIEKVWSYRKIP